MDAMPNLAVIRIQPGQGWCPPIPLPLFLLWIPGILLAPFVLLAIWIVCLVYRNAVLAYAPRLLGHPVQPAGNQCARMRRGQKDHSSDFVASMRDRELMNCEL